MSYVSDYLNTRNPYWSSMYDPSRYNNTYNSTPTKEKPPVTSSTLNDMTVAELEALAERTANTLREKKEKEEKEEKANVITFTAQREDYRFDKRTKALTRPTWSGVLVSVYQPVVSAFLEGPYRDRQLAIRAITDILTAITPTN